MLKPVLQLTVGGIVTVLLWKMAVVLLLPILGVAAGLLLMILKILFFAGIVLFVWLVYRYLNGRSPSAA
jgi:hypothetical protein